MHKN
jgi:hypothetical protein